jgi:predicted ATP-grasp superfamily ATP-dependent carboligase
LVEYASKFARATDYQGAKGFVVQQLIPGDGRVQFSYAGLWDHGREVCSMTARRARQFPAEFGTSPFVEAVELPRVIAAAQRLLQAVDYHGLVEVEFKLDSRDKQLKLLDVNTRIWAWIGLGDATDRDFAMQALHLATGRKLAVRKPARYGAHWVHSARNVLSLMQSLRRTGRLGFAGWSWLRPGGVHAVAATDDPRPGLVEIPLLIGRKLHALRRRSPN